MSAVLGFGRSYPPLIPFCQNVPLTLAGDVSMRDHERRSSEDRRARSARRATVDRRSGRDTRLDEEIQLVGEKRSGMDRRSGDGTRFVLGILAIALIVTAFTASRVYGL